MSVSALSHYVGSMYDVRKRKTRRLNWSGWWKKNAKKQKGTRVCDRCDAVYYDGHWHTDPHASEALKRDKPRSSAKSALCPQCTYVINGEGKSGTDFEGQITLDGLHDVKDKDEILQTVRNMARESEKVDPEDQIIAIDDRGERVVIATSDNRLAVRIGKKIDASFKGGTLRVAWSSDDLPVRVYWKHKDTRH